MSEISIKKDSRTNRVQSVKLSPLFFPLDIHKSMFINDLMITIPSYYADTWWKEVLSNHNKDNFKWEVEMDYYSPKVLGGENKKFKVKLSLSFIESRNQTSCYRIKWDNSFSVQLAKDYPKSFVRSLEFHIGDEYYKKIGFTEYDIGGFKEQLQMKIKWEKNAPIIEVRELFRVREESQLFPKVFQNLSSYLIADYLLSSEEEILRRIQVWEWKERKDMTKELNENNIYILANKNTKDIYFGETEKSLSKRYPDKSKHHCFDEWTHYCIIGLPPETSKHTRLLIERTLIASGSKLFENSLYTNDTPILIDLWVVLKNKKK